VCDDYAGYKALLTKGVLECGCLAHARRKLFDLHAHNHSQLAEQALKYFAQLYAIEREGHELDAHARCGSDKSKPSRSTMRCMLGWRLTVRKSPTNRRSPKPSTTV
jgi:hypothetical protein